MADRKISDLTALTTPASGDYLPIVDISEASAANKNKRITIEELLSGAPDGTAAAPGIAFESDPDSGLYKTGANAVAISTGGTGRLFIDANGNAGLGTSLPLGVFHASASGSTLYSSANMLASTPTLRASNTNTTAGVDSGITFEATGDGALPAQGAIRLVHTGSGAGALALGTKRGGPNPVAEAVRIDSSGRVGIGITSPSSLLHLADAGNITVGTTTGTKIGTATTQKLGFWNATPVVQPAAVADATDAATVITQLNDLLAKLRTLGIIAT